MKHRAVTKTQTIFEKALGAVNRLNISYHITPTEIHISHPDGKPYKSKEPGGIGRYLTQTVNRARWRDRLMQGPNRDGIPYECAKYFIGSFENELSNSTLNHAQSRASDLLLNFMIKGRLNTLPTPASKIKWHGTCRAICPKCGKGGVDLKHILNDDVIGQKGGLTPRHNAICHEVYNMIKAELGANVEIYENKTMYLKTLPLKLQRMRPDLWFMYTDNEGKQSIEIVEVTVPFASRTKSNQDTLQIAYDFKEGKYQAWREQVHAGTGKEVRQTTVVVSSLWTVFPATMKALAKMLRIKDAERIAKYGRKLSIAALEGSLAIWRQFNAQNAKEGREFEELEYGLEENEALYMEEGEDVTQEELRQGINIMAELTGEAEVAMSDLVPVTFQWRGSAPRMIRVNRKATDEMLEKRAQQEWRNNWIQLS
jgi:hypothetical protein